jgi:hypothetical protein
LFVSQNNASIWLPKNGNATADGVYTPWVILKRTPQGSGLAISVFFLGVAQREKAV